MVTWVPWNPVIMKKVEPNCGAPQGLPHGRTPSVMSLVHSKACMPTKVAPSAAVTSISDRGHAAVPLVAIFHRQRHRAAAGDQDEGHDGDQDQRNVPSANMEREHLAGIGPLIGRRHPHRHVGEEEAAEDEGVAEEEDPHHGLPPRDVLERPLVGRPVAHQAGPAAARGSFCLRRWHYATCDKPLRSAAAFRTTTARPPAGSANRPCTIPQ